jgi:RNA polymerase sigma-70 factor, ECF subfamily
MVMSASASLVPVPDLVHPAKASPALAEGERLRQAMAAHFRLVWRVLRRGGLEPRDADEAAQDVFWILVRRLRDVPDGAEKGFLVGTAVRVASERRRSRRRVVEVELDHQLEALQTDTDELVELHRARTILDEALSALSEQQRAVFVLVEMEQLTATEVALALSIPVGTVASRLRAARQGFDEAVSRLHCREQGSLRRRKP